MKRLKPHASVGFDYLSQKRAVRPSPCAVVAHIRVIARDSVQAGSSDHFAEGPYLIPGIKLHDLMILIPNRLRPQCEVRAVAITNGKIPAVPGISACGTLKFLLVDNFLFF